VLIMGVQSHINGIKTHDNKKCVHYISALDITVSKSWNQYHIMFTRCADTAFTG
jgi:hypothetical protein